jgi:hypothetical protein
MAVAIAKIELGRFLVENRHGVHFRDARKYSGSPQRRCFRLYRVRMAACGTTYSHWTLKVLRRYAADTHDIKKLGFEQTENAHRPFLALTLRDPPIADRDSPRGWGLENQGAGPALNIRHSEPGGNERWVENLDPIKSGNFTLIRAFNPDVMQQHVFTVDEE